MIGKLLAAHLDNVRAAATYRRLRASQFGRDQLRAGYRAALHDYGHRQDFPDPHVQTEIDGIEVDAGIAPLIEALWEMGLDTQFSCQGNPERYVPHEPTARDWAAHVVFSDWDDAVTFTRKTIEMLGYTPFQGGVMFIDLMLPRGEQPQTRAMVGFPPQILDEITRLWVELEVRTRPADSDALEDQGTTPLPG